MSEREVYVSGPIKIMGKDGKPCWWSIEKSV